MSGSHDETEILNQVSAAISEFDQRSNWHVSARARAVLQITVTSILSDRHGTGEFQSEIERRFAATKAIETLPEFLNHVAHVASTHPPVPEIPNLQPMKEIGALLILQNMTRWADLLHCTCWPRF